MSLYEVMLKISQAANNVSQAPNLIEAIFTSPPLDHAENTGIINGVTQFR